MRFQSNAKGARSMANPGLKNRELRKGHLKWTTCRCRGCLLAVIATVGLVLWAGIGGCVATAECDEHVGCVDGEVCFQSRCLSECDEDADCEDDYRCAPCENPEDGTDRCIVSQSGGCVEEDAS